MTYLLDTDICIYLIKEQPKQVLQRLYEKQHVGVAVSVITVAELEYGVASSAFPSRNHDALLQPKPFLAT